MSLKCKEDIATTTGSVCVTNLLFSMLSSLVMRIMRMITMTVTILTKSMIITDLTNDWCTHCTAMGWDAMGTTSTYTTINKMFSLNICLLTIIDPNSQFW